MSDRTRVTNSIAIPNYTPGVYVQRNGSNMPIPSQMPTNGVSSTGRNAYTSSNPHSAQRQSTPTVQGPFQSITNDLDQPRMKSSNEQSNDVVSHAPGTAALPNTTIKRSAQDYSNYSSSPQRLRYSNEASTQRREVEPSSDPYTPPTSVTAMPSSDSGVQIKNKIMEQHQHHDQKHEMQYLLDAYVMDDLNGEEELLEIKKEKEDHFQATQERPIQAQVSSSFSAQVNNQLASNQSERGEDHFQRLEQARDVSRQTSPPTQFKEDTRANVNKIHLMKSFTAIRHKLLELEMDLSHYLDSH